jgi:hypothetical protein
LESLQGELALIIESDSEGKPVIVGYKLPQEDKKFRKEELVATYLLASLDSVKYMDQELYTLGTYLTQTVGKTES